LCNNFLWVIITEKDIYYSPLQVLYFLEPEVITAGRWKIRVNLN